MVAEPLVIDDAVYWIRDVMFDEDRSTVCTGSAPQVLAGLRNTALNLHRLPGADSEQYRRSLSHQRGHAASGISTSWKTQVTGCVTDDAGTWS
jgi:hypothetical protein